MNLDIETAVRTIFIILLVGGGALVLFAVRAFREASRLKFFLKRREILGRAWQYAFLAILAIAVAFLLNTFAEPAAYRVFPPSPTASLTPTVTTTPTITQTPTITLTPTTTITPQFTPTPLMPAVITNEFTAEISPNPDAAFSEITFARRINDDYEAINPSDTFENPIETIVGSFSYSNMAPFSQWSQLWYRDGELIDYETIEWNGGTGGFGSVDTELNPEDWLPGTYEVQIFVGETFKVAGQFEVVGEPATPAPTLTATITPTVLPTQTPTITSTATPAPTSTEITGQTIAPTPSPTRTVTPSPTPTKTGTAVPTSTPTNTPVPTITLEPTPTRRSTIPR